MCKRHIFFFGDSFANGDGDMLVGGWVSRLCTSEKHNGNENICFYNLTIADETTQNLEQRWYREWQQRIAPGDVSCLVFQFGASDMMLDDNGAIRRTIGESAHAAKEIMKKALCRATVLWLGPVPIIGAELATEASHVRLATLNSVYAEMATNLGISYLNSYPFLQTFQVWQKFISGQASDTSNAHCYYAKLVANWTAWRTWIDPDKPDNIHGKSLKKYDPRIVLDHSGKNPYLKNSRYSQISA